MTPSESTPRKPGGLLARLFGLIQPEKPEEKPENSAPPAADPLPAWDAAPSPEPLPESARPPLAVPVQINEPRTTPSVPPAIPVPASVASLDEEISLPLAQPAALVAEPQDLELPPSELFIEEAPAPASAVPVPPQLCPSCQTPRKGRQPFCDDCGWLFPPDDAPAASKVAGAIITNSVKSVVPAMPARRIKDRYEISEKIDDKAGLSRYRGTDCQSDLPVFIVEAPLPELAEPLAEEIPLAAIDEPADEEILPTFEEPLPVATLPPAGDANWPGVAWEKALLEKARHPALPEIIDHFVDGNAEYLIAACPEGRSLWDAWDDPDTNAEMRYGWLKQIAEGLHALHQAGAIIEGLRPDIVTVTAAGQAMLADLSDLLPLPLPANAPIRGTLYTAPELVLAAQKTDARADLYSFGATLYALEYLHHALEEKDFEHPYSPKLITERYPDVHPLFFRLVSKTFVRDPNSRFPTDEAGKIDASGFMELIHTLDVCRHSFDSVRLDIAAWTTTGMVRTGNEDAFGFLHAVESRQDDLNEYAVVLLADGMGGYEAGEVAAAMAIATMREYLLQQPLFAALAGKEAPAEPVDVEATKKALQAALKHANKEVYTAARAPGSKRRGMGCTAEAVYVDGKNVVVGHVGDSRTYHLHQGRLTQLTRDQTLVNRLVELGQLTAAEADNHPRKNELQQAIGGQPDVVPGLYQGRLKRGDWVVVCSDGLTNHIPNADLEKMLTREAAGSAEEAARRLLNLVNLRGATDNATIVVVRAM